jgi:CHAD domain-containing protein
MAYRFQRRERIDDGVRRIVSEQIEKARGELNDDSMERADVIHQVRKRCKKIRAVVRLIRPDNPMLYKRENAFFRDLAGDVSALRDLDVMIETLEGLAKDVPGAAKESFESIRKVLKARREKLTGEDSVSSEALEALYKSLNEALKRVADWKIEGQGFEGLKKGLKKTYSRGRMAMARAYSEETRELFHDWRKRAKYHWYHVRLLRNVWKEPMRARAKELRDLGNDLGVDHDLAVLKEVCVNVPESPGGAASIELLLTLIDERRRTLEENVRPIGERVYAEKPKRVVKKLKKRWRAWRKE